MKSFFNSIALFIAVASGFLHASVAQAADYGELQLFTFQEGLPLEGVAVVSKGRVLGKTDADGSLVVNLPVGKQKIQLLKTKESITDLVLNVEKDAQIELMIPITKQAKVAQILTESNQEKVLVTNDDDPLPKAQKLTVDKPTALAVIEGKVISVETQVGIPNVSIFLTGIKQTIATDSEGRFSVTIPEGEYSISAVHGDYSAQTIKRLKLKKNQKLTQDLELTPAAEQLEEFIVTAPALEGGVLAVLQEKKKSSAVTEVLSAEEMSNSGDSSAGDALKRVTGITYVGGKYVYVRGMGDRYSATLLNKAGLPSPEPTKKVVPLDLFPTSMIGSITVQKTYSPDIPADFGGGIVLLKTKTIPEERKQKIKFSMGGNTQSTGKKGLGYKGSQTDVLGFDDGSRALPAKVQGYIDNPPSRFDPNIDEIKADVGRALSSNYEVKRKTINPDVGLQIDLADIYEQYGKNWSWGYNYSFGYKNKTRFREEFGEDSFNSDPTIDDIAQVKEKTTQSIDLSSMLNLMFEIGDNHKFDTTTILSRKTTDTVTLSTNYSSESTSNFKNYSLIWEERQLFSQQFHGVHLYPDWDDLEFEWQGTYSMASRVSPDSRFYQYAQSADTTSGSDRPYVFQTVGDSNSRSWETLTDDAISLTFDFRKPFYDLLGSQGSFDNGLAIDLKNRTSDVYKTRWTIPSSNSSDLSNPNPESFLNQDTIVPGGIELTSFTQSTDSYKADQSISAYYTKLTSKWEKLSLMAGARFESSSQTISTVESSASGVVIKNSLEKSFLLPSISLGYVLSESMGQVRFAYAQTLNRPDLKELSQARYLNPEDDKYYKGNPDLQIAEIRHYDFRWENYLSSFENVSIAYFIKQFTNPIELTQEPGGGTVDSFTYNNVSSATNSGVELQGRFWLKRFLGNWASAFYVDTNASFIDSTVDLSDAKNYIGTNKTRALQGQAPWVFNLNLGYENLVDNINANLVLNMTGDSISEVGVNGEDDTYLNTPVSLNFVYSQLLHEGYENKWRFKAKVQNILDGEFKEVVGESGTTVKKRYKKGMSFSAEISYSWQ